MMLKVVVVLYCMVVRVWGQRPVYAGSRPIGYPALTDVAPADELGNRFGESNVTTTTQRLPLEANGDKELVDRLSKLPKDQQPFWLLNWQALEDNRNKPQSYPQRPSPFHDQVIKNGQNAGTNLNTKVSLENRIGAGIQNSTNVKPPSNQTVPIKKVQTGGSKFKPVTSKSPVTTSPTVEKKGSNTNSQQSTLTKDSHDLGTHYDEEFDFE